MINFHSWKRNREPNISADNIGRLLMYLYGFSESDNYAGLFHHDYLDEKHNHRQIRYPLYIVTDGWLASAERPLHIEEPLSVRQSQDLEINVEYIKWKKTRQSIYDNPTYRLVGVESLSNGEFRFRFGKASYEQFLSSCEILYDELLAQLEANPSLANICKTENNIARNVNNLVTIWDRLALRKCFAPDKEALTNFDLRSMKLGITVALAFRLTDYGQAKDDFWMIPISKRNSKLAEYPSAYCTIPAGTFQPCSFEAWPENYSPANDEEFDMRYTVIREFLEEVLNIKESLPPRYFLQKSESKELINLSTAGKVRFAWTGLAIALETGKPELSCLLTIDDPNYFAKHQKRIESSNWESGQLIQVRFKENSIRPFLENMPIAPASAMALSLGLKVLLAPWFTSQEYSLIKAGTPLQAL